MPLTPAQIVAQAEAQHAAYRVSCDYRRVGRVIHRRKDHDRDDWADHQSFKSINGAKRYAREHLGVGRHYAV